MKGTSWRRVYQGRGHAPATCLRDDLHDLHAIRREDHVGHVGAMRTQQDLARTYRYAVFGRQHDPSHSEFAAPASARDSACSVCKKFFGSGVTTCGHARSCMDRDARLRAMVRGHLDRSPQGLQSLRPAQRSLATSIRPVPAARSHLDHFILVVERSRAVPARKDLSSCVGRCRNRTQVLSHQCLRLWRQCDLDSSICTASTSCQYTRPGHPVARRGSERLQTQLS